MQMMNRLLFMSLILGLLLLVSCNGNSQTTTQKKTKQPKLLAMVLKYGRYGYIDPSGEYVIPAKYRQARPFSDGLACVSINGERLGNAVLGGAYVFINTKGEVQFGGKSFSEPVSFYNGFAVVPVSQGKYGFINREGKLVASGFDQLGKFHKGWAPAMKKDKNELGYIDTLGHWKLKFPILDLIGQFYNDLAYIKDNGKYGFMDRKGKVVIDIKYADAFSFEEGLAAVEIDKKYGFINTKGKLVIPAIYDDFGGFKEGLCAVKKQGKFGFINQKGEVKISHKFKAVRDFHEGLASAMWQGQVGFINKKGNWVIPPQFESAADFKNGYAIIQQNSKMGFINKKGKVIIQPEYRRVGRFVNPEVSNKVWKMN